LNTLSRRIRIAAPLPDPLCLANVPQLYILPIPSERPDMAEVGTKMIFENEKIRVWEFTLEPGESVDSHRHDHDYFFYPIEGGTLEVARESGITRLDLKAGEVYFRKSGDTHAAKNVDDHRYHEVLVELKV